MQQKVFVYVTRTNQVPPQLLVFTSLDEPGFEVPKGSVEAEETLEQAVHREVLEEAGITGLRILNKLGVTLYLEEEQHFFLAEAPPGLDSSFEHVVSGAGIDSGFRYNFRWMDVGPSLSSLLVQGCNAFVEDLLEALGVQ